MSEREFENYLTLLGSLLRLSTAQREAVASELRDHLEERTADLIASGVDPDDAKQQAIAEFGDAARLAGELSRIAELKKRRWIMRMTTGTLAVAALLVFALLAFWPDAEDGPALVQAQDAPSTTESHTPDQPNDNAEAKNAGQSPDDRTASVLRRVSDIDFVDMPLRDALADIGDRLGINVLVDEKAWDAEAISTDTPITLNLHGVPMDFALEWMLRQQGLGYTIREGVVIVSSLDELANNLEVRVYDVRDLLPKVAHRSSSSGATNSRFESKPTRFGATGGVPVRFAQFGGGGRGGGAPPAKPKTPHDELIELITATVKADSWNEAGGPGSIRYYRGALVIAQTQEIHREIRQLLEDLRNATKSHPPAGVAVVKPPRIEPSEPTLDSVFEPPVLDESDRVVEPESTDEGLPVFLESDNLSPAADTDLVEPVDERDSVDRPAVSGLENPFDDPAVEPELSDGDLSAPTADNPFGD